uniref:Uncharacterized protein n=1 Tax=Anguilla anguilla TaxID=7936 RepID=A0A0E9PFB9_ANGAN
MPRESSESQAVVDCFWSDFLTTVMLMPSVLLCVLWFPEQKV